MVASIAVLCSDCALVGAEVKELFTTNSVTNRAEVGIRGNAENGFKIPLIIQHQ